jgi:hypothetical protein
VGICLRHINCILGYIYAISQCVLHPFEVKVKCFSILFSSQYEILCNTLSAYCHDFHSFRFWYSFLTFNSYKYSFFFMMLNFFKFRTYNNRCLVHKKSTSCYLPSIENKVLTFKFIFNSFNLVILVYTISY